MSHNVSRDNPWMDCIIPQTNPAMFEIRRIIDALPTHLKSAPYLSEALAKKIGLDRFHFNIRTEFAELRMRESIAEQEWDFSLPHCLESLAKRGNPIAQEFLEKVDFKRLQMRPYQDVLDKMPHPMNEQNKRNYAVALKWLKHNAKSGDAQSQYVLSAIYSDYLSGYDYENSFYWSRLAARQGHVGALCYLAHELFMHQMNVPTKTGRRFAERIYLALVDAGITDAISILASIYSIQHQSHKALKFSELDLKHHPNDYEKLKDIQYLYEKLGRYQDYLKVTQRLIDEHNDSYAMTTLGEHYLSGTYVEQDYERARYWLERACQNDYESEARRILSDMYFEGNGVEKNIEKGVEWLIDGIKDWNFGLLREVAKLQKENLLTDQQKERFKEIYEKLFKEHRRTCHDFWDWQEEDYMNWMKRANGIL